MGWWDFMIPSWAYSAYLVIVEHTVCAWKGHDDGSILWTCRRCGRG